MSLEEETHALLADLEQALGDVLAATPLSNSNCASASSTYLAALT